jgi:transcriptional regulator with XRE-family HTH domain
MAEARLKKFWADALTKAGGTEELAGRLARLGVEGRDGPYNPKSIEAWRGGRRQPGADVLLVVATDLGLSLDHYMFGRVLDQPADLAAEAQDLRRRQGILMGWLLELDDKLTERGLGLGLADRVSSLGDAPQERAG